MTTIGPDRAQRAMTALAGPLVEGLLRLPPRMLGVLSGPRPRLDDQRVSPALGFICRTSTPIVDGALANPSRFRRRSIELFAGTMTRVAPADVRADEVDLEATGLSAMLYTPATADERAPLLVYFHGGGYIFGSVAAHDGTCRYLAAQANVRLLSIEYPLAPEHPAPAAHEAALASWAWTLEHRAELGAGEAPIGVGGDSAGGSLALSLALRDLGGLPRPRCCFALYPVTDLRAEAYASTRTFGKGLLLSETGVREIARHNAPGGVSGREPHVLVDAAIPPDMPPTYIGVAGMDPLRDQGERFGDQLLAAGAPVKTQRFDNLVHGFATMLVVDECRDATTDAAAALSAMFES